MGCSFRHDGSIYQLLWKKNDQTNNIVFDICFGDFVPASDYLLYLFETLNV
jgi:hypothetical protein